MQAQHHQRIMGANQIENSKTNCNFDGNKYIVTFGD